MTEETVPTEGAEEAQPEHGRKIASFGVDLTLYDPDANDVSRAGTPIEPDDSSVKEIEETIESAVGELGYAVSARATRSDR